MSGAKEKTCAQCGKTFTKPCLLKAHLQRKTPCAPAGAPPAAAAPPAADGQDADQPKKFACKHCGNRFASQVSMYRHVRQSCKMAGEAKNADAAKTPTESAVAPAPVSIASAVSLAEGATKSAAGPPPAAGITKNASGPTPAEVAAAARNGVMLLAESIARNEAEEAKKLLAGDDQAPAGDDQAPAEEVAAPEGAGIAQDPLSAAIEASLLLAQGACPAACRAAPDVTTAPASIEHQIAISAANVSSTFMTFMYHRQRLIENLLDLIERSKTEPAARQAYDNLLQMGQALMGLSPKVPPTRQITQLDFS